MATVITESFLEDLKTRIDLVDLISSYGIEVKHAGATKKACCPFHREKTPSFHINETRGYYHCFGCGESGDAIKFVQKMEGLTFVEAVKKLAASLGIEIEAKKEDPEAGRRRRLYALMAELATFYHRCLMQAKEAAIARDYLRSRDLSDEAAADWMIGYAPKGAATILKWGEKHGYTPEELESAGIILRPTRPNDAGYHRFGGRLMFTVRDRQGRVVAFSGRQLVEDKRSGKYVNSPETPIFKKSNVLFAFDRAAAEIAKDAHHEMLVCEGQIDCIRLHLSGFPTAVASQGTAFTEEHVKMLKRVTESVVLVFDDDDAGHKATIKSARLLLAAEIPVRAVSLAAGDDPDSFLRTHPADDFRKLLAGAVSIISFQTRVARAKESDPRTIDAVNRVSRAVLETIACSKNAILRASMLDEAAKLLALPVAALQEELAKVKVKTERIRTAPVTSQQGAAAIDAPLNESVADSPAEPNAQENQSEAPLIGERAADALPPPRRELALCEFLMANEYDSEAKTLSAMLGEFLPPSVFAHDFTRAFVEIWRAQVVKGEDLIAPWGDALVGANRRWFDAVLLGQEKSRASGECATNDLQELVRALWKDCLLRLRGALPAVSASREVRARRMRWTVLAQTLPTLKWNAVKDIIRDIIEGERRNGLEGSN